MYLKDVQSLALDLKFFIIQRFNILVKLIACYFHKSQVFQPIIMYPTKISKTWKLFCACCYLKVHDSHSNFICICVFIQKLYFKV